MLLRLDKIKEIFTLLVEDKCSFQWNLRILCTKVYFELWTFLSCHPFPAAGSPAVAVGCFC